MLETQLQDLKFRKSWSKVILKKWSPWRLVSMKKCKTQRQRWWACKVIWMKSSIRMIFWRQTLKERRLECLKLRNSSSSTRLVSPNRWLTIQWSTILRKTRSCNLRFTTGSMRSRRNWLTMNLKSMLFSSILNPRVRRATTKANSRNAWQSVNKSTWTSLSHAWVWTNTDITNADSFVLIIEYWDWFHR